MPVGYRARRRELRRIAQIPAILSRARRRRPPRIIGLNPMTTRIARADVVLGFGAETNDHVYRHGIDIVFDESGILHLGAGWDGAVTREIDGRGFMIMPGLVDIHSHPSSEPGNKGITDEVGSPKLYNSSLYEFLWLFRADADGIPHLNHVACPELLMSGVTTLSELAF